MIKPALRGSIRPFEVMEAYREAEALSRSGHEVLHLSLGQPGRGMPERVQAYLRESLQGKNLPGYTDACGIPELRERIAAYYKEIYGLTVPVERIFVTVGSSSAFSLAMMAAFDVGSRIGIARPCYPAYPNMMRALGLAPFFIDTSEDTQFQPEWEMLSPHADDIRGMVIASPSNPTGALIGRAALETLATQCKKHGIHLISDEIYHGVTYGRKAHSALEFSDEAIVVNSFSKYFLLPGLRIGWAVMPEALCRSFESLLQNFFISPPLLSQYAALKVFECRDELDGVVHSYDANRDLLALGLKEAGFRWMSRPDGAFYIYANTAHFGMDSKEFCHRMLNEAGVCAIPGIDFDEERGREFVRFSYSGDHATIERAMERLRNWLAA